jgi:hypothetical protein
MFLWGLLLWEGLFRFLGSVAARSLAAPDADISVRILFSHPGLFVGVQPKQPAGKWAVLSARHAILRRTVCD